LGSLPRKPHLTLVAQLAVPGLSSTLQQRGPDGCPERSAVRSGITALLQINRHPSNVRFRVPVADRVARALVRAGLLASRITERCRSTLGLVAAQLLSLVRCSRAAAEVSRASALSGTVLRAAGSRSACDLIQRKWL